MFRLYFVLQCLASCAPGYAIAHSHSHTHTQMVGCFCAQLAVSVCESVDVPLIRPSLGHQACKSCVSLRSSHLLSFSLALCFTLTHKLKAIANSISSSSARGAQVSRETSVGPNSARERQIQSIAPLQSVHVAVAVTVNRLVRS